MAYSEQEARELIVKAGRRLKQEGLIARTWGNLSARISDDQFVITPSGLDYDIMGPGDLVTVSISDCSYEGKRKPSSEKGIHADAYKLHREICFVIHTHQEKASVFGVLGENLEMDGSVSVLGSRIPCAEYGLPSTKRLRQAVAEKMLQEPEALAVLLKNHGALCMGKDYAQAFLIARELERACDRKVRQILERGSIDWECVSEPLKLGKSQRRGNRFCHLLDGERRIYDLRTHLSELPLEAAIHSAIYRGSSVSYIAQETGTSVLEICRGEEPLPAYLDDLAQIAGVNIRFSGASPEKVAKALKGRNAVLIRGRGALCTGRTADDVEAVRLLLRKGCEAALVAKAWNERLIEEHAVKRGEETDETFCRRRLCQPLGETDARLQRFIYQKKYSRKKDS
ncbi:MAG: class II aldolase/adducin family protein [Lachnospiraceae bacterium]|nr:class II aldolase/adducin family protein [Lachnospiraceae bacterium]